MMKLCVLFAIIAYASAGIVSLGTQVGGLGDYGGYGSYGGLALAAPTLHAPAIAAPVAVKTAVATSYQNSNLISLNSQPIAVTKVAAPVVAPIVTKVATPLVSHAQFAPAVSYAAPAVSYAAPALSYAAPALSYAAPAVSYASPSVGYAAPSIGVSTGLVGGLGYGYGGYSGVVHH